MICCRHATGPLIAPVARDTSNYRFVRQIGLKTLLLWRTVLIISSNLNYLYFGADTSPFVFYCRLYFTVFTVVLIHLYPSIHPSIHLHPSIHPSMEFNALLNSKIGRRDCHTKSQKNSSDKTGNSRNVINRRPRSDIRSGGNV